MKFYTYAELCHDVYKDDPIHVENAILHGIDLVVIGHFGNSIFLSVSIETPSYPYVAFPDISYNNIPRFIRLIFDLLHLSEEDGRKLSSVKDMACRVAFKSDSRIAAIGHFLRDEWMFLPFE